MNAATLLTSDEKAAIEAAIAKAEKRTAAEIVCAISTESGRYDREEAVAGFVTALVCLGIANAWSVDSSSWGTDSSLPFVWQVVVLTLGFVAGNAVASYVVPVRRLCVTDRQKDIETRRAASHVFAEQRVYSTRCGCGLLLYVSLFERRVVVLADDAILNRFGQDALDQLRNVVVSQLKAGRWKDAFTDAIASVTDDLSKTLPTEEGDQDELPNRLICFHPRP